MNSERAFHSLTTLGFQSHSRLPFSLLLLVLIGSITFAQSPGSASPNPAPTEFGTAAAAGHYLTAISIAVAILAALTTIAIFIPTILAFVQIRRVEKEWERFTKMADAAEQRIFQLRESVREFRTPTAILKEAADKAEAITETEVKALREFISAFEDNLKRRLNTLQSYSEKHKTSLDEFAIMLNHLKHEVEKKPSANDVLVLVGSKYKIPDDLKKDILQKVGLAFVCLRELSDDERKDIMKVLVDHPADPAPEAHDK